MQTIDRSKIALVHIAKQQLAMTDNEYSAFLSSFNVSSSKEITNGKFLKVMERFKELGFKPKFTQKKRNFGKLKAIVNDKTNTIGWGYVNGISNRMFKKEAKNGNEDELRKIISAVNYKLKKDKGK